MKRRPLFWLLIPLALMAMVCAGVALGIRAVLEGGKPLEDGRTFADGRFERVVGGYSSAFVLEGPAGVVLVDADLNPQAPALVAALERRGHSAEDVEAIVFTHGHGDHIGGALAFPGAALYALEPDVDLIEGRRAAGNLIGRFRESEPTGLVITRALQDGETLGVAGLEIEVFAMPGHSLGSAALLCQGVLFLGDAAASTTEGQLAGPPPVFSADRDQGLASLQALSKRLEPRASEIEWLVPSHQGALAGAEALMAWGE